jgi:hypothetical protein
MSRTRFITGHMIYNLAYTYKLPIPTENGPACFKNTVLKYSQDKQINNNRSL